MQTDAVPPLATQLRLVWATGPRTITFAGGLHDKSALQVDEPEDPAGTTALTSRRAILVIDDDDDIAEGLSSVLGDIGYEVDSVRDGEKALAYLSSRPRPSLILLDLMMPRMNGLQLRERLAADQRFADIPIIVVTASRGYDASHGNTVAGWINKPFNLDELINAVAQHVGPAREAV